MDEIKIIDGEVFKDHRGTINSLNTFLFDGVKRTYIIYHPDSSVVRGWHGHQNERKWFYCIKGSWTLAMVKIDDWENPSRNLEPEVFHLSDSESRLLCIPAGYANCLKADSSDAIIQVYSDVPLPEAYGDSWRYPSDWWIDLSEK